MNYMKSKTDNIWDVIVIGGGSAGMMAAGRAAECGARVALIEKNDTLGKKLLITGGGRCNLTNAEFNTRKFLEKFKDDGKFLFSAFSQWSVQDTLNFFNTRGMATKIENEQRVFPASDSARSVWDVLVKYMREGGVTVISDSPVSDIIVSRASMPKATRERRERSSHRMMATRERRERSHDSAKASLDCVLCANRKALGQNGSSRRMTATGVILRDGKEIHANAIIVAAGGGSHPETGSAGDGFAWLKKLGHNIAIPTPSLVPVAIKDSWAKQLSGVSIADVKINAIQNEIVHNTNRGKILFTHFGISGPAVLHMSKAIGELLKSGEVVMSLDILPSLNNEQLDIALKDLFKKHSNKKIRNSLDSIIPSALAPIIIAKCKINPETVVNSITREERMKLIACLKNLPMRADKLLGADKAVITSGGVSLEEIDPKTMRSRLFPNLYIIGDMLNIDRPSGGYSLQLCWTTGFVAGTAASKNIL